jgi:hypothetical protein
MRPVRQDGAEHPGIKWGPFTARIPFYHTRIEWPEFWQGFFVAGATGLGLVPILEAYFGLSFEVAVAVVFIHSVLLSTAPILFGEPFAPGWITPALPLVLLYVLDPEGSFQTSEQRLQFMTAVSIDFALVVFFMGITGLGKKFIAWMPPALKGAIILGAAIAALKRVFLDDYDRFLQHQTISTTLAISICLILTFSQLVQHYKKIYPWVRTIAGLGLLPGFLAAAIVGPFVGGDKPEIVYEIENGFWIPPFGELFHSVSPFAIGFPEISMFIAGIPLALMGYTILFGDLVTGMEILRTGIPHRPDEKISIDVNRSHLSIAIRNLVMAFFAPFFPSQGCLWTGVQVIIVQRWTEGRKAMESIYSGIFSYYVFGVPVLYMWLPVITGLRPLMDIALALTLVLTGFACAYVAMELPKTPIERGVILLGGMALAVFSPWVGLAIAILATFTLVDVKAANPVPRPEEK